MGQFSLPLPDAHYPIDHYQIMNEFKSIAREIMSVSKDPPVAESVQQSLLDYWQKQIGIAAPHTYPLLFQSGRLVVFCNSAVWATQIRHQTPSLLRQLHDSPFKVSDINTKIRPVSSLQSAVDYPARKSNPISKDNANALRHLATKVRHSGLRKSLLQLAKKAFRETTKTD